MDAPRTATGSPCKLCLKKGPGDRCHLHGGTPRTPGRSPKKSPSPKWKGSPRTKVVSNLDDLFGAFGSPKGSSPKSAKKSPREFHYLEALPEPALQQVLLNMEWVSLSRTCKNVPKAQKICREYNFQQLYLARHQRPLFWGLRSVKPTRTTDGFIPKFSYRNEKQIVHFIKFEEDVELQIWFTFYAYIAISVEWNGSSFGGNVEPHLNIDFTGKKKEDMFIDMGKPEWLDIYKGRKTKEGKKKWRDLLREIIRELQKTVNPKDAKKLDVFFLK